MFGSPRALAVIFAASGVAHLVAPKPYEAIVPTGLPAPRALVYGSGVAELACAAGLATGQSWAGNASTALLLGVWPANFQMALDATRSKKPWWQQAAVWSRLPLQIPLLRMARAGHPAVR